MFRFSGCSLVNKLQGLRGLLQSQELCDVALVSSGSFHQPCWSHDCQYSKLSHPTSAYPIVENPISHLLWYGISQQIWNGMRYGLSQLISYLLTYPISHPIPYLMPCEKGINIPCEHPGTHHIRWGGIPGASCGGELKLTFECKSAESMTNHPGWNGLSIINYKPTHFGVTTVAPFVETPILSRNIMYVVRMEQNNICNIYIYIQCVYNRDRICTAHVCMYQPSPIHVSTSQNGKH